MYAQHVPSNVSLKASMFSVNAINRSFMDVFTYYFVSIISEKHVQHFKKHYVTNMFTQRKT